MKYIKSLKYQLTQLGGELEPNSIKVVHVLRPNDLILPPKIHNLAKLYF